MKSLSELKKCVEEIKTKRKSKLGHMAECYIEGCLEEGRSTAYIVIKPNYFLEILGALYIKTSPEVIEILAAANYDFKICDNNSFIEIDLTKES